MNEVICKLCSKTIKNSLGVSSHLRHIHPEYTVLSYYNKFCKKSSNEGQCKMCKKPTSFDSFDTGYRLYCSSKCANNDSDIQAKIIENSLLNYGVERPTQNVLVKDKIKQTNLIKYGVVSYLQTDDARHKMKIAQNEHDVKEKRKQTCITKYGVDNPFSSKDVQNKVKQTNLLRYGAENLYASDYGKQKIAETNLTRYGSVNYFSSKIGKEHYKNILKEVSQNGSKYEAEISQYIQSICNCNIVYRSRSIIAPYELDLYIPEKQLAIEYNGLYWHSTKVQKDYNYHLDKTILCECNNIHLLHINEFEWTTKKDICKSIISDALNIYSNILNSSDCFVMNVHSLDAAEFIKNNSLYTIIDSCTYIGLYNDTTELVQLLCINTDDTCRIITKLNYNIIDGVYKLIYSQPKDLNIILDRSKDKLNCNLYTFISYTEPTIDFYSNKHELYNCGNIVVSANRK